MIDLRVASTHFDHPVTSGQVANGEFVAIFESYLKWWTSSDRDLLPQPLGA
jgi:hypothetical protein